MSRHIFTLYLKSIKSPYRVTSSETRGLNYANHNGLKYFTFAIWDASSCRGYLFRVYWTGGANIEVYAYLVLIIELSNIELIFGETSAILSSVIASNNLFPILLLTSRSVIKLNLNFSGEFERDFNI